MNPTRLEQWSAFLPNRQEAGDIVYCNESPITAPSSNVDNYAGRPSFLLLGAEGDNHDIQAIDVGWPSCIAFDPDTPSNHGWYAVGLVRHQTSCVRRQIRYTWG
jgi:hypothetical protein